MSMNFKPRKPRPLALRPRRDETPGPSQSARPRRPVRRQDSPPQGPAALAGATPGHKDNNELVRLNKYIASAGVTSRRGADEMIYSGQVRVNGHTITSLGTKVHPKKDQVVVNGKPIKAFDDMVYVMFHKPTQVVSTMVDPEGRPTIADYFTKLRVRVFPVGRLDWESEGMILLTNDGDFAQKVTHPKHEVPKTYLVKLDGQPTPAQLQKLTRGVSIIGGKARALAVERIPGRGSDKYDWIKILISEGRNRQIRQMIEKIGMDVKKLQRVAIGSLKLGTLERGKYKILTAADLDEIFRPPKELSDPKLLAPVKEFVKPREPFMRPAAPSAKESFRQKALAKSRDLAESKNLAKLKRTFDTEDSD